MSSYLLAIIVKLICLFPSAKLNFIDNEIFKQAFLYIKITHDLLTQF